MASELALKCAQDLYANGFVVCHISPIVVAEFIDRHFPVPTPGKEAEDAVEALLRALGPKAEYFLTPTEFAPVALATIASAYAPLLKQAHDALAEAIDCIRVFHGSGTAWDIYESCSPEMKQIKAALAALREDKHEA